MHPANDFFCKIPGDGRQIKSVKTSRKGYPDLETYDVSLQPYNMSSQMPIETNITTPSRKEGTLTCP